MRLNVFDYVLMLQPRLPRYRSSCDNTTDTIVVLLG